MKILCSMHVLMLMSSSSLIFLSPVDCYDFASDDLELVLCSVWILVMILTFLEID